MGGGLISKTSPQFIPQNNETINKKVSTEIKKLSQGYSRLQRDTNFLCIHTLLVQDFGCQKYTFLPGTSGTVIFCPIWYKVMCLMLECLAAKLLCQKYAKLVIQLGVPQ
jgi:hypothetical protein